MMRTTIYLSDEVHNGLKHLAVERRQSMANLLRQAVEEVYKNDLADLRAAQKTWKAHLKQPDKAVSARKYFAKRSRNVPG
jgi:predicted transcriptional regulator